MGSTENRVNPNARYYVLYLDRANLNIGTNIVEDAATDSTVYPMTYLKDSHLAFTDRKNGHFHTYDFAPSTNITGGKLHLDGTNTFAFNTDVANNKGDALRFTSLDAASSGKNYVTVVSDPSIGRMTKGKINGHTKILSLTDTNEGLAVENSVENNSLSRGAGSNVVFTGRTGVMDSPLGRFYYIPTLGLEKIGNGEDLFIKSIDYWSTPSEGMKTASDTQMALRNIWFVDNMSMMQRFSDLHLNAPYLDSIWIRYNKGELSAAGAYNRSITQKYNQVQIGYDKGRDVKDGKLYGGVAISHLDDTTNYESGSGKARSNSLSIYGTWVGKKGHYLDLMAKGGRLHSEYSLYDVINDRGVQADYDTPAYSLSAEYGYRQNLSKDYFIEPQAQLIITSQQVSGLIREQ